jgi:cation:H+ antiporter
VLATTFELALGLALLVFAADQLVVGAARVTLTLRISAVLVGAVIIGFGTSTPELLVTALAGFEDAAEIAAGNLVGSNIVNLAVVAAVAALITPLSVSSQTLRREVPLATVAVLLFATALQGGLTRTGGLLLLAAFGLAAIWIVQSIHGEDTLGPEAAAIVRDGRGLRWEATRTTLGLLGTLAGAQLVVSGSQGLATELGVREGFVGLTIVALGTSLPELVTALQAARRRHVDLIVGNVLGSNLFNSLLAGGILAVVAPGPFADPDLAGLGAWFMVGTALLAGLLLGTGRRLVRWEGALLLTLYAAILPLLAR